MTSNGKQLVSCVTLYVGLTNSQSFEGVTESEGDRSLALRCQPADNSLASRHLLIFANAAMSSCMYVRPENPFIYKFCSSINFFCS